MGASYEVLRQANKQRPETKVVWIAVAFAAASSIIASLELGWSALLASAGYIFGILIANELFLALRGILRNPGPNNLGRRFLSALAAWSTTVLLLLGIAMLVSSLYRGWPGPLPGVNYHNTNPEPNTVTVKTAMPAKISQPAAQNETEFTASAATSHSNANVLRQQCLNAIDLTHLSVAEVEARARICLAEYGGH